jgi:hypothetical protein
MQRQFIRMSDLDRRAREHVETHRLEMDRGKKVLDSLLGSSATQKDWLESARHKYEIALGKRAFDRVAYLIGALYDAYRSRYRLPAGRNPQPVEELIARIETSYANTALEYIDSRIRDDLSAPGEMDLILQAIALLEEENPRLAQSFTNMLKQAMSREESAARLDRLLDTLPGEITADYAVEIARAFSMHEKSWKTDPALYDSMLVRLRNTMEGVYLHALEAIRHEEDMIPPSLRRVIDIIEHFSSIYAQFKPWVHDPRFLKLAHRIRDFEDLLHFLDREYPALRKTYSYLGLPRDTIDQRALLDQFRKIDRFTPLLNHPWKEIADLDPTLPAIAERIEQKISESYRKELIHLHKSLGDLLAARDGDDKIREVIRFALYLKNRIPGQAEYLALKLTDMLRQVEEELERLLENRLIDDLSGPLENARIQRAFDFLLKCWAEDENLEKVEDTQSRKIALQRDIDRFRQLTGDVRPSPAHRNELRNLVTRLEEYRFSWLAEYSNPVPGETASSPADATRRLVLMDRYSPRNLVVFLQDRVTIGRATDNDIVLDSEWVSGHHAELDFVRQTLTDLGSTNGTFLDGHSETAKEAFLTRFDTFDLAHSLQFRIRFIGRALHFFLDRVVDNSLSGKHKESLDALRATEFLYLPDGTGFSLDRDSGRISDLPGQLHLRREGNRILFSDLQKDMRDIPIQPGNDEYSERFSFHWV